MFLYQCTSFQNHQNSRCPCAMWKYVLSEKPKASFWGRYCILQSWLDYNYPTVSNPMNVWKLKIFKVCIFYRKLTWKAGMVLKIRASVDTMTNPIDITAITCNTQYFTISWWQSKVYIFSCKRMIFREMKRASGLSN